PGRGVRIPGAPPGAPAAAADRRRTSRDAAGGVPAAFRLRSAPCGLRGCLARCPDLADRFLIALCDRRPVDHVPPGLEVFGAAVLVLEVVRVLPDVDPEQRLVRLHDRRVLVRRRVDPEPGAVVDEPPPA